MQWDLVEKAVRHLKKDPRFATLIKKYPKPEYTTPSKAFKALARSIVYQQLSGKAAGTIFSRFEALYPGGAFPTPEQLAMTSDVDLRSVGLSAQKSSYLKDLAAKFMDGTIQPRRFSKMSDEEIYEHIVTVKGIGPWTCHMFLMFTLGRPDVLPTGDLGIQKGMQRLFKLKSLPTVKKMEELAAPWRPYRTVACWYLWRLADEGNNNRPGS